MSINTGEQKSDLGTLFHGSVPVTGDLVGERLFPGEVSAIRHAKELLSEEGAVDSDSWREAFAQLLDHYGHMLRYAKKITSLSDSAHRKLLKMRESLTGRNQEIQSQQDALLKLNRELERAGVTDALTELYNRRYVYHYLPGDAEAVIRAYQSHEGEMPENQDLIFLMIDIDFFKEINDRYGHIAGDRVLKQIAAVLQGCCRRGDIVARWGGEEFLIIHREANRLHARELAERVRRAVAEASFFVEDDESIACTCSVGFSAFPILPNFPRRFSWLDTIQAVDLMLITAKRSGRDCWVGMDANPDMAEQLKGGFALPKLQSYCREGAVRLHMSGNRAEGI